MVVVGEGLWSPRSHSQALFLAPFGVQASRAVERAENEARTCLGKAGRMCVAPEQAVERAENEARTCLGKAGRTCVAPEQAVERAEDEGLGIHITQAPGLSLTHIWTTVDKLSVPWGSESG